MEEFDYGSFKDELNKILQSMKNEIQQKIEASNKGYRNNLWKKMQELYNSFVDDMLGNMNMFATVYKEQIMTAETFPAPLRKRMIESIAYQNELYLETIKRLFNVFQQQMKAINEGY